MRSLWEMVVWWMSTQTIGKCLRVSRSGWQEIREDNFKFFWLLLLETDDEQNLFPWMWLDFHQPLLTGLLLRSERLSLESDDVFSEELEWMISRHWIISGNQSTRWVIPAVITGSSKMWKRMTCTENPLCSVDLFPVFESSVMKKKVCRVLQIPLLQIWYQREQITEDLLRGLGHQGRVDLLEWLRQQRQPFQVFENYTTTFWTSLLTECLWQGRSQVIRWIWQHFLSRKPHHGLWKGIWAQYWPVHKTLHRVPLPNNIKIRWAIFPEFFDHPDLTSWGLEALLQPMNSPEDNFLLLSFKCDIFRALWHRWMGVSRPSKYHLHQQRLCDLVQRHLGPLLQKGKQIAFLRSQLENALYDRTQFPLLRHSLKETMKIKMSTRETKMKIRVPELGDREWIRQVVARGRFLKSEMQFLRQKSDNDIAGLGKFLEPEITSDQLDLISNFIVLTLRIPDLVPKLRQVLWGLSVLHPRWLNYLLETADLPRDLSDHHSNEVDPNSALNTYAHFEATCWACQASHLNPMASMGDLQLFPDHQMKREAWMAESLTLLIQRGLLSRCPIPNINLRTHSHPSLMRVWFDLGQKWWLEVVPQHRTWLWKRTFQNCAIVWNGNHSYLIRMIYLHALISPLTQLELPAYLRHLINSRSALIISKFLEIFPLTDQKEILQKVIHSTFSPPDSTFLKFLSFLLESKSS